MGVITSLRDMWKSHDITMYIGYSRLFCVDFYTAKDEEQKENHTAARKFVSKATSALFSCYVEVSYFLIINNN